MLKSHRISHYVLTFAVSRFPPSHRLDHPVRFPVTSSAFPGTYTVNMMISQNVALLENDDAELVSACLDGHLDSYGRIVERYQNLICSLAYSATGSVSRSEDLAQETFVTAWKALASLREPEKLRPWLCGIARNLIGKAIRADKTEPVHAAESLEAAVESTTAEPLPAERIITKEEEAILWRAIERVPEMYREPLVLYYREHQSVEKVAEALDLTQDTVRQRLSRGRKLLHEQVISFVEGALEDSAPGKAFTVGVLGALPLLVASTAGASAATTASAAVAKSSATAKSAGILGTAGALLTGGVIAYFSVLGFLMFLGVCAGYIMNRALRRSTTQLKHATSFWRNVAISFGLFVVAPPLVISALKLSSLENPEIYRRASLCMGLIYLAVPALVFIWLWRWSRGTGTPTAPERSFKRFYVWLGLGMIIPTIFFAVSIYGILFQQSLTSQRLTPAQLQTIVSERKDAEFRIEQYRNGSQSLLVKLPESGRKVLYHAPVGNETSQMLERNQIVCQTYVQGKDFDQFGAALRLIVLLAFFLTPMGVMIVANRPRVAALPDSTREVMADAPSRNVFRAFAVSLALGLIAAGTFIGLITRWDTRAISESDLSGIISEYPAARYTLVTYGDGSTELSIMPREHEGIRIVAPATAFTLATLHDQGIAFRTISQGRDFGYADLKPAFSFVCILTLIGAAVVLLAWAAKGLKRPSLAFRVGFVVVFLTVTGLGFLTAKSNRELFVSVARVNIKSDGGGDALPDGAGEIQSAAFQKKVLARLGWALNHGMGRSMVETMDQSKGEALEIVVYDQNDENAAAIANAIAEEYVSQVNTETTVAEISCKAQAGTERLQGFKPVGLILVVFTGCLLGALGGAMVAWLQRRSLRAGTIAT